MRAALALAAVNNYYAEHVGIKSAFLHEKADPNIQLHMHQPPRFNGQRKHPGAVGKAIGNLYGSKQACKIFMDGLHKRLMQHGFYQHQTDASTCAKRNGNHFATILITIDDMLIISNKQSLLNQTKKQLKTKCETKELGPVSHILQWKITRNRNTITINQPACIDKSLNEQGMANCKPTATPCAPGTVLANKTATDPDLKKEQHQHYQQLVGSLRYLADSTRPDIACITGQLGRHSANPTTRHQQAAKRVLRYLQGTRKHGITYGPTPSLLHSHSDSDYAADPDTRKSTTGNMHILNGGPISWRSTKQDAVVLSTTEAECIAASAAARRIKWLRAVIQELHPNHNTNNQPTPLHIDNQSAIKIAQTQEKTRKSKCIDVRHHYLKQLEKDGIVQATCAPTNRMRADFLTKQLKPQKYRANLQHCNITAECP